jgi:hypothetical protein
MRSARGEFPEAALPIQTNTRSFDCIVVRFANNNFAQDDSVWVDINPALDAKKSKAPVVIRG